MMKAGYFKQPQIYTNDSCSLFLIKDGEPVYISNCVTVDEMTWNSTGEHILMSGYLPTDKQIFDWKDGLTFEITHKEYGKLSDYQNSLPLFRISNCKIVRRWIGGVVNTGMRPADTLRLKILMNCDIEALDWGKEQ